MCQRKNRIGLRGGAEIGGGIRFVASLARNQLGWIRLCMTETTRVSRRTFMGTRVRVGLRLAPLATSNVMPESLRFSGRNTWGTCRRL